MKAVRGASLVVMGWYLFLVVLHYFNQRPLWNDESCVFANIDRVPIMGIFQHALSHHQEFPRIYLFVIAQLSELFSDHLLALRFLPFVCMISAFFIWIHLASKQIRSPLGQLTFLSCWAASIPLIYYAAELKQYSMDVLTGALFLLFLFHQNDIRRQFSRMSYALLLIGFGTLGLWSYSVFLFMPLVLYNLWVDARKGKDGYINVWLYGLTCMSCFLFVYLVDFRHGQAGLLEAYWKDYFINVSSVGGFFQSVGEGVNNLISRLFAESPKWLRVPSRLFVGLGFVCLLISTWSKFKKDGSRFVTVGSIAGFIVLEYFILSTCRVIPFGVPRLSLFLAPMLFYYTVEALEWLKDKNKVFFTIGQGCFLIYLVYVSLGIAGVIFKGDLGAEPIIWH